ncbi:hypothetical protein D6764_01975, partial [Candidatus Woesearchaeota archaeon]
MADEDKSGISGMASAFLERFKNKVKRSANKAIGRDVWHITKVRDEETILEEELREHKNKLVNMLNSLKEMEELYE